VQYNVINRRKIIRKRGGLPFYRLSVISLVNFHNPIQDYPQNTNFYSTISSNCVRFEMKSIELKLLKKLEQKHYEKKPRTFH